MRRRALVLVLLVLTATTAFACGSGGGSSGGGGRQVLVDYNNPDFANLVLAYFPDTVSVHAGETVHFKQAWNGEPHSVTMGTLVEEGLGIVNPLLQKYPNGEGAPPEAEDQFNRAFEKLPFMFGDNNDVNQGAAQPCYLDTGTLPTDPKKPCPKRAQPAFNGKQAYYSSGFIPYAGNNGNSFDVKLAADIKPGTYAYYCNFHGPEMQGRIIVKPAGAAIPPQSTVDKAALTQAKAHTAPVAKALDEVAAAGPFDIVKAVDIAKLQPPLDDNVKAAVKDFKLAGYGTQDSQGVLANEFLPRTIRAKVGEKVTWVFFGIHTVSFDVPRYFPLLIIDKNGTVNLDPRASKTRGPGFPEQLPDNAPNPFVVDGGKWNGSGFVSSGFPPDTNSPDQITAYSLTFGKAGTYQYACLIHPKMVGTVIVK
jgi:plastocyanin